MRLDLARCQLVPTGTQPAPFVAVTTHRLEHALVDCRGTERPGAACPSCRHFLDAGPESVRCLVLENDAVEEVMTAARHLATVDEGAAIGTALDLGAKAVVVTAYGAAVGIVTAGALARRRRDAKVRTLLRGPAPVVARTASLGAVAERMDARGIDAVLVCDGEELVGAVTRAALPARP